MNSKEQPTLFTLMTRLTAEARQKFGERRRAFKSRDGVEERLVEGGKGEWKLEYWSGTTRIGELHL